MVWGCRQDNGLVIDCGSTLKKTSVHHPVSNRVTPNGVGLLPGQQARIDSGGTPLVGEGLDVLG